MYYSILDPLQRMGTSLVRVEKRINEGRPYLQMQMRRGVWVSFCKIAIVSFLSVGYKSDGLYCRMAGTPSSPTLFFMSRDSYKRLSWWWWCVCHPSFLTIRSASNDYDVSHGISATRPHFSAPICRNPLVSWNQPHPSPTSSKQPQGIYFEWNLIRVYF